MNGVRTMAEYWTELPLSVQKFLSYAAIAGMKFPVAPVVSAAELDDANRELERARQPHEFLRALDDYLGLFTDEHFHEAALDHKIVNPEPLYSAVTRAAADIRDQDQLSPSDETFLATHLYLAQQGLVDVTEGAESGWRLAEENSRSERFSDASIFALQAFRLKEFEASTEWMGSERLHELCEWCFNSGSYKEVIDILSRVLPSEVEPKSNRFANHHRILLAKSYFEINDQRSATHQLDLIEREWEPARGWPIHLFSALDIAEVMIHCERREQSIGFMKLAYESLPDYHCPCGRPNCDGGGSRFSMLLLEQVVVFQWGDEAKRILPNIRSQVEETWGPSSEQSIAVRILEFEFYVQTKLSKEAVELVRELQPLIDGASTSTLRVKFYMLSAILFGTLGQEDEMKKSRDICAADLPHARGTVNRYIKWFNDLFGEDVTLS